MVNLKNYIPYRMISRISIEEGVSKRAVVYTTDGQSFDIHKDRVDIIPGSKRDSEWIVGVMTEIKKELHLPIDLISDGTQNPNNLG